MEQVFDNHIKFPNSRLTELGFNDETINFLTNNGLPNWCAPNIHFGEEDSWLPQISNQGNLLTVIGSDRDDSPICINKALNVVRIKNNSEEFMASNLELLYSALINFQKCINGAVLENDNAFVDNNIPEKYLMPFVTWLKSNEPKALKANSFWGQTLSWLKYAI